MISTEHMDEHTGEPILMVTCDNCDETITSYLDTKITKKNLKARGWHMGHKYQYCPRCAEKGLAKQ